MKSQKISPRILSLLRSRIERESDIKRHRHGAIIVDPGGYVVSAGCNVRGKGYSSYFSLHAEEVAIARASNKRGIKPGSTMYVARLKDDGSWGLSAPCDRCQALINEAGITKVVFT